MQNRALITGITGQDGAYLARFLLQKGYEVVGGMRRTSSRDFWRLDELGVSRDVEIVDLEMLEFSNLLNVISRTKPTEVYNLAAQSFVGVSFQEPVYTGDVDGLGVGRLLEAIRTIDSSIRFYQASTSEMFGKVRATPQDEDTPFHPRSPYGVAKLYAHWMTVNYREAHRLHANSGILFNHESHLRGPEFVTRKVTLGLAAWVCGLKKPIQLGNTAASRDWGHAKDYVEGMWLMLQQDEPDDYVLATGETHTVETFATLAAKACDISLDWSGDALTRKAVDARTGETVIETSQEFFRPAEVDILVGDATKARSVLGWKPKTSFPQLVEEMMNAEIKRMKQLAV